MLKPRSLSGCRNLSGQSVNYCRVTPAFFPGFLLRWFPVTPQWKTPQSVRPPQSFRLVGQLLPGFPGFFFGFPLALVPSYSAMENPAVCPVAAILPAGRSIIAGVSRPLFRVSSCAGSQLLRNGKPRSLSGCRNLSGRLVNYCRVTPAFFPGFLSAPFSPVSPEG